MIIPDRARITRGQEFVRYCLEVADGMLLTERCHAAAKIARVPDGPRRIQSGCEVKRLAPGSACLVQISLLQRPYADWS